MSEQRLQEIAEQLDKKSGTRTHIALAKLAKEIMGPRAALTLFEALEKRGGLSGLDDGEAEAVAG